MVSRLTSMFAGRAVGACFIALHFVVGLTLTTSASDEDAKSGLYKLADGARYLLCRRFLENLNSFPELERYPLEIPIRGDLPYFRKPKWTPLDPKQHLDLVKRLTVRELTARKALTPNPEDDRKAWELEEGKVRDQIDAGLLRLGQTRLDYDHDGLQERVYRFGRPLGDPPEIPWSYHVLVPPGPDRPPYYGRSGLDVSTHLANNDRFDSFFHEGRFYLISLRSPSQGPVIIEPQTVRSVKVVALKPVCHFRYPRF